MQNENCIFCKIVSDKIHARILMQNDRAVAMLDAFPLAPGHTLVIPKSHYGKVQDMDKQGAMALFEIVWKIAGAVETGSHVKASTIAIHNGIEAGQEIPHVHVHIVPRKKGDGAAAIHSMFKGRPQLSAQEMDTLCNEILGNL
jgi:histidine triad (HIT) family protein